MLVGIATLIYEAAVGNVLGDYILEKPMKMCQMSTEYLLGPLPTKYPKELVNGFLFLKEGYI